MKIHKVRVVKEDGYFYPEYKWLFWWHKFGDYGRKCFVNFKDAKDYATDQLTVIKEIE